MGCASARLSCPSGRTGSLLGWLPAGLRLTPCGRRALAQAPLKSIHKVDHVARRGSGRGRADGDALLLLFEDLAHCLLVTVFEILWFEVALFRLHDLVRHANH